MITQKGYEMKMVMLYGYAPNDMPVFTNKGCVPRADWLEQQAQRLNEHGIKIELKQPAKGKYKGQSSLKVQDRGWTQEQWEEMRRDKAQVK